MSKPSNLHRFRMSKTKKNSMHPRSKDVAIVALMGALGNVLATMTTYLGAIHPQIAIDLSHLATFIVAIYRGPMMGAMVGAIVSLEPFYRFGIAGWLGPIVGLTFIPGKAMTGYFAGIFAKRMRPIFAVLLGYVPESIFTYITLKYLTMLLLPQIAPFFTDAIIFTILAKAWMEILFLGFLMEIIARNKAVKQWLS